MYIELRIGKMLIIQQMGNLHAGQGSIFQFNLAPVGSTVAAKKKRNAQFFANISATENRIFMKFET